MNALLLMLPILSTLGCLYNIHWISALIWAQTILIIAFKLLGYTDTLTASMLFFVSLLSAVIFSYAKRYMATDSNQNLFLAKLCGLTTSVLFLILAQNLLTAFVGWQGISYFIYQLLTHYRHRPQAIAAAKHKCLITRLGDISFLIAIGISYATLHSSQYTALPNSPQAGLIAFLLVFAVMTKASLFPFHTWLPNTLETPTPVSALMHAGVINAGGFLLMRTLNLMSQHIASLLFLTLIGMITAAIGAFYSLIQPSIKKRLAYSTVSQMGFMFFQYGLGSPASALFHLFSHGLYKATAFLDSGNALKPRAPIERSYSFLKALKNSGFALLITASILWMTHYYFPHEKNQILTWGFISLSLFQWVINAPTPWFQKTMVYTLALLMTFEYAKVISFFETLFKFNTVTWLPINAQIIVLMVLWAIQLTASILPPQIFQKTPFAKKCYRLLKEHRYV